MLRVVGRDARGRESIDFARAARFVREHATELGVGAALLGGAILGTLYHKRAVPTEPVNEFDLHMPRPVQAPVALQLVPPPNVAKVWLGDQPSRSPVSGYRAQSLRSEADAGAPRIQGSRQRRRKQSKRSPRKNGSLMGCMRSLRRRYPLPRIRRNRPVRKVVSIW